MRLTRIIVLAGSLLCFYGHAVAQGAIKSLVRKVSEHIDSMTIKGVNRNYIDAPEKPWQIIAKNSTMQSTLSMTAKGNIYGIEYNAQPYLKIKPAEYVGVWVGYRGYGLGYSVKAAGDKGKYFTVGATGGTYGIYVRLHSFKNSTPNFKLNSKSMDEESDDEQFQVELCSPIKVNTLIADAYYLFNGKRFSYSAAYDQSVIQKKSAGSLMVGAMYYYTHIDYSSEQNGDLIYMMKGLGRLKLWQGSIGVGYAYNWVPARGLLISAMVMPMLTPINKLKAYGYNTNVLELMNSLIFDEPEMSDEESEEWFYSQLQVSPMGSKTVNSGLTANIDARLSLTYNFKQYFINAYGQFNTIRYHHDSSHGHLNDWFINASIGVRL